MRFRRFAHFVHVVPEVTLKKLERKIQPLLPIVADDLKKPTQIRTNFRKETAVPNDAAVSKRLQEGDFPNRPMWNSVFVLIQANFLYRYQVVCVHITRFVDFPVFAGADLPQDFKP
jgi:hypothetical protein